MRSSQGFFCSFFRGNFLPSPLCKDFILFVHLFTCAFLVGFFAGAISMLGYARFFSVHRFAGTTFMATFAWAFFVRFLAGPPSCVDMAKLTP